MTGIVEDLGALRHIAFMGGIRGFIEVGSQELGKVLGVSQQTASRRIRDLERLGYIRREMGVHRQLVRVTDEGITILKGEFAQYQRLFEAKASLNVRGIVASGLGEGAYYLSQLKYVAQFEAKLGFRPYPGTLNVEVPPSDANTIRVLKSTRSIAIEGFQDQDRSFGAVDAWRARLKNYRCAVILPHRSHHARAIEIIAVDRLRDRFGLKDGDALEVVVELQEPV